MAKALTGGIGAASQELQLQCFCVDRHQADSRRFMFRPGIPATSDSSARKVRKPISLEAGMTAPGPWGAVVSVLARGRRL